jgi:hypothetical protein
MKKQLLISSLIIFCFVNVAFASPKRISGKFVDLGKVQTIYMVPGMATLVEIPTSVTGIRLGNPEAVEYFRPDKPENEVTLVLRNSFAKPTNLIIRSNKKKYIFDIVPSKTVHQDSIEVLGSYGGPELVEESMSLIASSSDEKEKK